MRTWMLVVVTVLGVGLTGCQKDESRVPKQSSSQTKAVVRNAAGEHFDLTCLRGKSPSQMGSCKVDVSAAKKNASPVGGYGYGYDSQMAYFIWDLIYFHEQEVCQWLFGIPSCYQYFGFQGYQGQQPYCDWNWMRQGAFPYPNGLCGGYWDWWRRPNYGDRTCDELYYDREAAVNEINYCNTSSDCVAYTNQYYQECNGANINRWANTYRLDAATRAYSDQCTSNVGAIACPAVACLPAQCTNNRCSSGCLVY